MNPSPGTEPACLEGTLNNLCFPKWPFWKGERWSWLVWFQSQCFCWWCRLRILSRCRRRCHTDAIGASVLLRRPCEGTSPHVTSRIKLKWWNQKLILVYKVYRFQWAIRTKKRKKVRSCPKSGPALAGPAALPLLLGDSPTTMLVVDRRMVLNNDGRTTKISVYEETWRHSCLQKMPKLLPAAVVWRSQSLLEKPLRRLAQIRLLSWDLPFGCKQRLHTSVCIRHQLPFLTLSQHSRTLMNSRIGNVPDSFLCNGIIWPVDGWGLISAASLIII